MGNFLDKQFGRLGNRMFQMAVLYAYARELGVDYYFQDEKWFEKYANEVKQLFSETREPINKVAIHVRRGTNPTNPNEPAYAENPFYVNLSETDYYERAIEMFPNDEFLVFSDDIAWCVKKWNGNKRFQFSIGKTEEGDLRLMSACKHNIIANSSFSWWGAYLNSNPDKKVIYPKAWYADGVERTKCPKEWICL